MDQSEPTVNEDPPTSGIGIPTSVVVLTCVIIGLVVVFASVIMVLRFLHHQRLHKRNIPNIQTYNYKQSEGARKFKMENLHYSRVATILFMTTILIINVIYQNISVNFCDSKY